MGPTLIIACDVMREELQRVPRARPVDFTFLSMGLHVSPERLRATLQEQLNGVGEVSEIVLGFGLCGGATEGLRSTVAPLFVPRVHDCIPVLRGPLGADRREAHLEKGTFYLSGGWMEGERTLVSEHRRAVAKFGEKKAHRILNTMFAPYDRLLFLRTDHPRQVVREQEAQGLSDLLGLPLDRVDADSSYLGRLVNGPWGHPAFARFAPGEPIARDAF
jgi:hypothetical protein